MEVYANVWTKFDIKEAEQYKVTIVFLQELFGYNDDMRIDEKGMLIEEREEYGGSHEWIQTKIIREATEEDKLYFKFIKLLKIKRDGKLRVI